MTGFDTHPLPELGADGLDDFRVSQPLEIQTLLRQMARENVLLTLRAPRGISYPTSLWEVDHQKGFVALDVGPAGPALDRVQAGQDFDVGGVVTAAHGTFGDAVKTRKCAACLPFLHARQPVQAGAGRADV